MKKSILFITAALFFAGCSTKEVPINITQKPNAVTSKAIRNIRVDYLVNDTINLRENIIRKMYDVNAIIPGYFQINTPNYESILNGYVKKTSKEITYTKTVPIKNTKSPCVYMLYSCKAVSGAVFCKDKPSTILTPGAYDKIKKSSYKNSNYILYKNSIYKVTYKCKPTRKKIKCQKKSLNIQAHLTITDKKNNTLLDKTYYADFNDDSCKNVKYYENKNVYSLNYSIKEKIPELSYKLASEIIDDIAPHQITIYTTLFEKPDIDMNSKDEDILQNTIKNFSPPANEAKISILTNLLSKYPQSAVIKYDLAVFLTSAGRYQEAKSLLESLKTTDSDIISAKEKLLTYLQNTF